MKDFRPVEGMVCIAKLRQDDGNYYRVRVQKFLKDIRKVRVYYLDTGMCHVLRSKDLQACREDYQRLPPMAVKVSLAEVDPVGGKKWIKEASEYLKNLVKGKELRMIVKNETRKHRTPKVFLYEKDLNDICINTSLVDLGHATPWKKSGIKNMFLPERLDDAESGDKISCTVILASSPSNMIVRKSSEMEDFFNLCRDLSTYYDNVTSAPYVGDRKWVVGAGCVARVQGEGWARAQIVRELEGGEIEILLVDYRVHKVLGVDLLRDLPLKFTMSPMSWKVHLSELVPAGGSSWTMTASEKLREVVNSVGGVVNIKVMGDIEGGSWPVSMFIVEKNCSDGPLEPEKVFIKSIGDILKEEGLALPSRSEEKTSDDEGHREAEDKSESVEERFQWLGPALPSSSEFSCQLTHLDQDGILHVATAENQENLQKVQSELQRCYYRSVHSKEDLNWSQGEACIALYTQDQHNIKMWHRGLVLKVLDEGACVVKFVDYGNEEKCCIRNLRKGLLFKDLPIQCFTVQLNIQPVTEGWTQEGLALLHEKLDHQVLNAVITEDRENFPLSVSIITKSELDIENYMKSEGFAKTGDHILMNCQIK